MAISSKIKQILKADTSLVIPNKDHLHKRLQFLVSPTYKKYEIEHNGIYVQGRDAYILTLLKEFTDEFLETNEISNIVELLPGAGEEFALAFSLSGYKNKYDKIDLFHFLGEKEFLNIRDRYSKLNFSKEGQIMSADIFLWAKHFKNTKYDAILAKHPFDDLIIGLYAAENGISSYEYFSSVKKCKEHWDIAISSIDKYLIHIKNLAKDISNMINVGGYFVGLNHPDTFAVKGGMSEKIIVSEYAKNLFVYELLEAGFEYTSSNKIRNYNDNTYPNSLFVLKKVIETKKECNKTTIQMIEAYLNKQKPDLVHPSVFSILSYHTQPEAWYHNMGGEKIHSEIGCLLKFIEDRSALTDNKALIQEKIASVKKYFEEDHTLKQSVSEILSECLELIGIDVKALEIFTTLEPCKKRHKAINCKSILKDLNLKYYYGSTDSITQSQNDYILTCDSFISYNRLHFLALYFLYKYDSIFVAGGNIFVEKDQVVYEGGFTSEGDLMGLKNGVLFINAKKVSIEEVQQKANHEKWEPLQIIINVEDPTTFDINRVKAMFNIESIYLVTYY